MFDVMGFFENTEDRIPNTEDIFNPRPKTWAIYPRRWGDGFGFIWYPAKARRRKGGKEGKK
jgi:hypothetical protein